MCLKLGLPEKLDFFTLENETPQKTLTITLRKLGDEKALSKSDNYFKYSEINSNQVKNLKSFTKEVVKTKLNAPNLTSKKEIQITPIESQKKKKTIFSISSQENTTYTLIESDEGYKLHSMGQFQSQNSNPILSNSQVNFNLEVPKGVALEKLNQFEKIVYGFNSRLQRTFSSSLFRQFAMFIQTNPHFPQLLMNRKEILSGRLTYDKNGNLVRVRTLKGSYYDKLQEAFLNSLNDVSIIPNIPEIVLNENEQMNISITLEVN